jgi:hypothetical protein
MDIPDDRLLTPEEINEHVDDMLSTAVKIEDLPIKDQNSIAVGLAEANAGLLIPGEFVRRLIDADEKIERLTAEITRLNSYISELESKVPEPFDFLTNTFVSGRKPEVGDKIGYIIWGGKLKPHRYTLDDEEDEDEEDEDA